MTQTFADAISGLRDTNEEYRPLLLSGQSADTPAAIADLIHRGVIWRSYDNLEQQLGELIETRAVAAALTAGELASRIKSHLNGCDVSQYGTWVVYPWSGRLLHVLPEAEFAELRHSRNRNKITNEEQKRLAGLRIGIIGLSVGSMTAVTLTMEGVGGELVLADMDRLSLSNLNRVRAGVHNIGLNKTHVTAREIFEINPYARVSLFPDGITADNMGAFLVAERKLDLLIEECDDVFIKFRIREQARALGIPTIMETSDRGLFDVERFDREPTRALFHGLTGERNSESLTRLSAAERVPIVLQIVDESRISARGAASMLEVGSTLKTWPQLASSVSLGAAINVDVARRIALDQFQDSGRYYVDLEELIANGRALAISHGAGSQSVAPEGMGKGVADQLPLATRRYEKVTEEAVRALVGYAAMAPSGGNCQPWRFELHDNVLHCIHVRERSTSFLDYRHRASYLAFGALIENFELAAGRLGLRTTTHLFPDPSQETLICTVDIEAGGSGADDLLFDQIARRATNRKLGKREQLKEEDRAFLTEEAARRGGRLQLLTGARELDSIGAILGQGDRLRFLSHVMHGEMMSEIRWTPDEVVQTRDGLDVATLELSAGDLAGIRISSRWRVMELVDAVGGGRLLERASRRAIAAATAVGLISCPETTPQAFFQAGRAMQRVWLGATSRGLSFQPMTALTYLFARSTWGSGEGLSAAELSTLAALRRDYCSLFRLDGREAEGMLFRLSYADPPSARALRRPVADIFQVC